MSSSQPFFTDGMTVDEILNLGDDVLSTLSKRDLSRALRTVSLAANKRINRLQQYAYKRHGQYIEKLSGPGLDLTALNNVGQRFSVGDKNRNEIYQEFARARNFMRSARSTVSGAKTARKNREKALFGKTREQMMKGMNKKEKRAFIKNLNDVVNETYKTYHEFEEEYELSGIYDKETGRKRLRTMGEKILKGENPEKVKKEMAEQTTADIIKEQAKQEQPKAFWQELTEDTDNDEWELW